MAPSYGKGVKKGKSAKGNWKVKDNRQCQCAGTFDAKSHRP